MAETNVDISSEKSLVIDGVLTRNVGRKFGRPSDYVELHIYDISDNLLYSEEDFKDYGLGSMEEGPTPDQENLNNQINIEVRDVWGDKIIFNGTPA